eukprot:8473651-Alexandrium_andersonii.AAC.1
MAFGRWAAPGPTTPTWHPHGSEAKAKMGSKGGGSPPRAIGGPGSGSPRAGAGNRWKLLGNAEVLSHALSLP